MTPAKHRPADFVGAAQYAGDPKRRASRLARQQAEREAADLAERERAARRDCELAGLWAAQGFAKAD